MQIYSHEWVKLPFHSREHLHKVFGLKKSVGSEVAGGVLLCDGHSHKDLEPITTEKMQEYTKSKSTDFVKLWEASIKKAEHELAPKLETINN